MLRFFSLRLVFSCFFLLAISGQALAVAEKITMDFKGMDVVEVLKILAAKNNLNLVVDKNVSGRVTVFLKEVPVDEALKSILASSDLALVSKGSISRIMTSQDYEKAFGRKPDDSRRTLRLKLKYLGAQDAAGILSQIKSGVGHVVVDDSSGALIIVETPQKLDEMRRLIREMDQPMQTRTFELNYAVCQKAAEAVREVLSKTSRMVIDERSGRITATDYPARLDEASLVIEALDKRSREVLIEAKIIQVNLNDKTSLGIDWEYVLNKKVSVQGMFGQMITTTGNKWVLGSLNPSEKNDYKAVIEALETQGETKILSSPRLAVVNNASARILVGSKQVYVTTTAVQGQSTTETAEAVNFVDVGVKLYVTPTISADGFISMKIRPEVSSVTQNYKTAAGNTIPIVETAETETDVLLRDGQTLVIGGLIKDESVKTVNRIPWIGDIPLLGFLFRNSIDETRKTELVIFLTCRILDFDSSEVEPLPSSTEVRPPLSTNEVEPPAGRESES
ncbi:MAG: secretin N-terminal domain-containing protein [Candidatus Omnitrophota bacterium]